jgi:hypothetical protein
LVDTEIRFFTGLEVAMQRRVFSREFKLDATKLIKERGVSVAQVARCESARDWDPFIIPLTLW